MLHFLVASKHQTTSNFLLPPFSPPGCGVTVLKVEEKQNWWRGSEESLACALRIEDVLRALLAFRY